MNRKARGILRLTVLLLALMSMTSVGVAAAGNQVGGDTRGNEVALATQAAQAFVDSSAINAYRSGWNGALVTDPRVYHGLDGNTTAFGFSIAKDGEVVGEVIVGSAAYGYAVFEAGSVAPRDIPTAGEAKPAIERALGLDAAAASVGEPVDLLYLGIGGQFAVYQVEGEEMAVSLLDTFATPAISLGTNLVSPAEYGVRRQASIQARAQMLESRAAVSDAVTPESAVQSLLAYGGSQAGAVPASVSPPIKNVLPQVLNYWYDENNNCGPEAGVVIAKYWRDWKGFSNFPSNYQLYLEMKAAMEWDSGSGVNYPEFIQAFNDIQYGNDVPGLHGYDFDCPWGNVGSSDYQDDIIPRIDAGIPVALLTVYSTWAHWWGVKGYDWLADGTKMVMATSEGQDNNRTVNWDAMGFMNRWVAPVPAAGQNPPTRTLTTSSTAGGSVIDWDNDPNPDHNYLFEGAWTVTPGFVVQLRAYPPNSTFIGWTGTGVTAGRVANPSSPNTSITMDGNYTVTANFTGADVTISATLQGSGRPDPAGWQIPITVGFFTPGANVLVDSPVREFSTTTVKLYGKAVCQVSGVPAGTYDITAVSDHTLLNVKRNVVLSTGGNGVDMGTLLEGNANGDAAINLLDFNILKAHYLACTGNANYDASADFNRDGCINLLDFNLLKSNYLKTSPITVP